MTTVESSSREHHGPHFRRDIQGLRAVAVILVILDHLYGWPHAGFIGVDVFFVISGFLITQLLLREGAKSGGVSIANFYRRRARRILPMALVVLAATLGAAYLLLLGGRFETVRTDAIWALFFSVNWHLASAGTDYFQASLPPSPLQHYWSLAVEEQFYVIWPILVAVILLVVRRSKANTSHLNKFVAAFAVLAVVGSFAWAVRQTGTDPTIAYFSTFTRAWELGAGALLAACTPLLTRMNVVIRNVLAALGLAGIAASAFVIDSNSGFPAPMAALPVVATVAVIASGIGVQQVIVSRLITSPPIVYVGTVSFSLYLWHWPVIIFLEAVMNERGMAFDGYALGLMVALTVASYHLIEKPILDSQFLRPIGADERYGRHWLSRSARGKHTQYVLVGAFALVFALLAVFAFNPRDQALPAQAALGAPSATGVDPLTEALNTAADATTFPTLSPSLDKVLDDKAPEMVTGAGCLAPKDLRNTSQCTFGPAGAKKTAMVVGDSIAMSWMPGIRAALVPLGYSVHGVGMTGCPFAEVAIAIPKNPSESKRCNSQRFLIDSQIKKLKPDVLITSSSVYGLFILASGATGEAAQQQWTDGTVAAIKKAKQSTRQVIILGPNPPGRAPSECVTAFSKPSDCMTDPPEQWAVKRRAETQAAQIAGAEYVDTQPWFCDGSRCPIFAVGTPIRWDDQHMTESYGKVLAPYIAKVVESK